MTTTKPETPETTFADRITAALMQIKRLEKTGDNKFAGYAYTPVDDVKDLIRPILGECGLYISVSEEEFDLIDLKNAKGQTSTCAKIKYLITIMSGAGLDDYMEDRITVVLPYTGAQTTGAARSYAVKEWAKATLLVSTGETDAGADADMHAKDEYKDNGSIREGGAKGYETGARKMPAEQAEEAAKRLVSQIRTTTTHEELDKETRAAGFKRDLNELSTQWPEYAKRVTDEGKAHRQKLVEASNKENFPVG